MNTRETNILVTVHCTVYNHELYLRQCLDGFVNQKTNFKFEVIVHDDASTDNSAKIIREYENKYPEVIKPIYQTENQYSKNNGCIDEILIKHTQGKYIAICEGDDYWIDQHKLQKQINILESDKTIGLCYTKAMVYNQSSGEFENYKIGSSFNNFEELLLANKIPTLTTIYKTDLYKIYKKTINPNSKNWKMGDYPLWLWFCANSKIKFLEEETAVYRLLENSASHSDNYKKNEEFTSSTKDIRLFFHKLYSGNPLLKDKIFDSFYRENIDFGVKRNLRLYIIENLKKIKYKNTRETIKYLFYQTKAGYYILNKIK